MENCCETSRRLDEPIGGTAVAGTQRWLLVQVQSGWKAKTAEASPLQGPVRDHIEVELERIGGARLQLIRHQKPTAGVTVFAVTVSAEEPRMVRLDLPNLQALAQIDIGDLFEGGAGGYLESEALVLVCTHGTRDRCCAKEGIPVFEAIEARLGDRIWQTTHLGGHRFAATVLVLPSGLQFGRVRLEEVPLLLDGLSRGEIYNLDRFRGVVSQGRLEQVARAHLRRANAATGIQDIHSNPDGSFELNGRRIRVQLSQRVHATPRPYSCGDESLRTPVVYSVSESG